MKTETKFNIGDIVQHIHNSHDIDVKGRIEFIVLMIHTETCHGGTQSWYSCRPAITIKDRFDKENAYTKEVRFDLIKLSEIEIELVK